MNQRLLPTSIEPRGAAATYDRATGEYTVWMTSQCPHIMRLLMTAFVFGIPETKMRCISPQVGGAFGSKIFLYPEYVLVAALAEKLGRPVKWVETRRENYAATTHGRDHVTQLEVGAKRDGTITALRVDTLANLGGILSTIAPGIPTTLYGRMLSGAYRIPAIHAASAACTRTPAWSTRTAAPAGPRRRTCSSARSTSSRASSGSTRWRCGAGTSSRRTRSRTTRPASSAGFTTTRATTRRRSTARSSSSTTRASAREQEEARADGRQLGIGFSTYVEMCGVAPSAWIGTVGEGWGAAMWESANVRVHLTGKVVVTSGSQSHGQGHETTVSQVVASELGVPLEDVTVEHSDTLGTPFGYGTYGSRSAAVGSVAVYRSVQRIKDKARRIGGAHARGRRRRRRVRAAGARS